METQKFGVIEAVSYGVRTFIDHFMLIVGGIIIAASAYFFIRMALLTALATYIFSNISHIIINTFIWGKIDFAFFKLIPPHFYLFYGLCELFLFLIYYGFTAGMIRMLINIHDKNTGNVSDLFSRFYLAPRLWITSILYGLIILGGFILLIVPGIFFAIRFSLYDFFTVDADAGILNSLRYSYRATAHHAFRLLGVIFLLFLFNFIPLVGVILSGLITPIVMVYVYRKLAANFPAARV